MKRRARTTPLPLDFYRPIHPVAHEEGKRRLAELRQAFAVKYFAACGK